MEGLAFRPMPPGFRAEDFLDLPAWDGFMPLGDAANDMGISEEETTLMAAQGKLRAFERGGVLYVRPALVSTIGIAS